MKLNFKWIAISLISCLGVIVYSNSFHCSFHLDDQCYVIDNSSIRQISDLLKIWKFYPCRFVAFLSIAINYHFHQLDVFGYHLFNLLVHLVTAILVWWMVILTLSTPAMKENKITRHSELIALCAGLIFVSHPAGIEAVTYICQRAASMATMLYVASLCFYIKSRMVTETNLNTALMPRTKQALSESPQENIHKLYFCSSWIVAVLAMYTKENAITLPLMIVLYEYCFLNRRKDFLHSPVMKYLVPFLLTMLLIPLTMLLAKSKLIQQFQGNAQGPGGISPLHYLFTQFRVMVTYIRLVFLPVHLNLDYDYPVFNSFFDLPVLISFISLITILVWAKSLFSKYRLIAFSIFWFFLVLLPESSIIPFLDVIFEHRLYLPLVGYSIFLVGGLYYLLGKWNIKWLVMTLMIVIVCNSILTYKRNKDWSDNFRLWNDAIAKSPQKARPYISRGFYYYDKGDLTAALTDYNKGIELNPHIADAYGNRGNVYDKQGKLTQAMSDFNKALELNPDLTMFYVNRGLIHYKQGHLALAMAEYNKAIERNSENVNAYINRCLIIDYSDFVVEK